MIANIGHLDNLKFCINLGTSVIDYCNQDSDQKDASRHKHVKSPLVIQHGLFGTKENWKTVGKELNHITNRTVYSLDGRNHGESPHTNEMTFALMAKDVRNFCEQNNHEKIWLNG